MLRQIDGKINRWKDRQMKRQIDKQMERQIDGKIDGWKDRQIERQKE